MSIQIRAARPADIPAVVELQSKCPEAVPWPPDGYQLLLNQGRRLLVAELDGRLAGFLLFQELPEGDAEILNLAVDPSLRRRGVAAALFARVQQERPGELLLEVRESNAGARAFYARLGFAAEGRRKRYYHQPVEDALLLRRRK